MSKNVLYSLILFFKLAFFSDKRFEIMETSEQSFLPTTSSDVFFFNKT